MAGANREFTPNQVFVGLPWKNVRSKYERIIQKLEKKYPLYFTIVGRDDGQDAKALFEVIKGRIGSSSYAVFDATGGNANVSLDRALALKLVKALGGKGKIRRAELVQRLQADDYSEDEIDTMLQGLHSAGVLKCTVGKYSDAYVA